MQPPRSVPQYLLRNREHSGRTSRQWKVRLDEHPAVFTQGVCDRSRTCNLRLYCEEPALRPMYEQADLVLADGMPLLWAARLQRTPIPQRVPGSELIYTLTAAAARAGRSVFLLGGNPGAADGAAIELRRLNPSLKVAGTFCPHFGF